MFVSRHIQFLINSLLIIGSSWFFVSGEAARKIKCKTCKEFVESFEKRFTETENSNYAGGDTSWEEEKLGSYANSEVRFIEIIDGACRPSNYECHRLVEDNEEDIERWWFKLRRSEDKKDLREWLCNQHLDVCCPENTFGPNCEECPGGVETPCGEHGTCKGAEEKDGSGKCECDVGYEGITCQSCDSGYFNDTESDEFTCKACDKACKDTCEGPGPENCGECASGYEENEEGVCKDIDECKRDESICKEGTYCLNVPGKHRCNQCDKSCKHVCNGPGPSKCAECANGYSRDVAGICKDDNECEDTTVCSYGTFCENSPGSYVCKACHISCLLNCTGPGADGCDECKDGYTRENETCIDADECSIDTHTCDIETEVCHNLAGTYFCKCKQGLFKTDDGKCVFEEPTKPKKTKKKKKKKSKKGKASVKSSDEETAPSTEERGGEKEESSVSIDPQVDQTTDGQDPNPTEKVADFEPASKSLKIEPADVEPTSESLQSEPVAPTVDSENGGENESNRVDSDAEVETDTNVAEQDKQVIDTNTSGTVQPDDPVLKEADQSTGESQYNQEEHDEL